MKTQVSLATVGVAAILLFGACGGDEETATPRVVEQPTVAGATGIQGPTDPLEAFLLHAGTGDQSPDSISLSTIKMESVERVGRTTVLLVKGTSNADAPRAMLVVMEPGSDGALRPDRALESPRRPDGTFLLGVQIDGQSYAGYIGLVPGARVGYRGRDGNLASVAVEASSGIVSLPGANASDLELRIDE